MHPRHFDRPRGREITGGLILSRLLRNRYRLAKFVSLSCYWLFLWPFRPGGNNRDLVCIVPPSTKGWILEAICRETVAHWPAGAAISHAAIVQPPARTYFLCHYTLIRRHFLLWPRLFRSQVFVFYTHPRDIGLSDRELLFWLNQTSQVIAMCARNRDELIAMGLAPDKVSCIIGAADPDFFTGHERRSDGLVGFCAAYYERKDPDRVLQIVKAMPRRSFLLVGRGWEAYPRFAELTACANFEYVTAVYEDYPELYKRMTVFVSPARLEGGPISLIETMMENVVPVASDTGFAPDIIEQGRNGYIFPADSGVDHICDLIEQAFENRSDIRETVKHLTWQNFARQIDALR